MKVAGIQHDIVWEDAAATHARVAPRIAAAAAEGAELVVLTEMFSTGFSMNTEVIAQPVAGPSATFLADQAAEHGVWIAGSISTDPGDGGLAANRFHLVSPDGSTTTYDKIHPFTFAAEDEHYRAGDSFVAQEVAGVRLSLFVCYDLRFADEFWAVGPDTDCFVIVANWPAARSHHWSSLLVARAIENQCYVVAVNRVGFGGAKKSLEYSGDSVIIDPLGRTIAAATPGAEETILADVDPSEVVAVRDRFRFLQDRR